MSGYIHGITTPEIPTSLLPPVRVDSALPVVFGTAPVHNLPDEKDKPVQSVKIAFSLKDYTAQFGTLGDGEKAHDYTLTEFAESYFGLYGVGPVVFCNVFDPAKHKTDDKPDVAKVDTADYLGTVSATGKASGLLLLDEVFPRFSLVPGQILAPGVSGDPAVALNMGARATGINGHFKANAIIDIPAEVKDYREAPAWMKDNNLTDPNIVANLGNGLIGGVEQWGSTHIAGVTGLRDAENSGIPFWSPSNKRLYVNGLVHGGEELVLDSQAAQFLNGNGIITGLNFIGGMKAWGNRTAAYPGITDPKDTFIPVRRMMNFISNTIVLTAWQMLDSPIRRRFIESCVDSLNVWLNGLRSREFILGGRVAFLADENPTTDLMDGIVRFHVFVTPCSPARHLEFILEYDPTYISTLFAS